MSAPQYKVCPGCRAASELHVTTCSNCGHHFRTAFAPQGQTILMPTGATFSPQAARRTAWLPWVLAGVLLLALGVTFRFQTPQAPIAPSPATPLAPPPSQDISPPSPSISDLAGGYAAATHQPGALTARVIWRLSTTITVGELINTSSEPLHDLSLWLVVPALDETNGIYSNPHNKRVMAGWATPEWKAADDAARNLSPYQRNERAIRGEANQPSVVSLGPRERCTFQLSHSIGIIPVDIEAQDASGRKVELTQELYQAPPTFPAPRPSGPVTPQAGPSTPPGGFVP